MNEKKRYEKAVAEVILFDNSDVITTSGLDGTNTGGDDCKNYGWTQGNCQNGGNNSGKCSGGANQGTHDEYVKPDTKPNPPCGSGHPKH